MSLFADGLVVPNLYKLPKFLTKELNMAEDSLGKASISSLENWMILEATHPEPGRMWLHWGFVFQAPLHGMRTHSTWFCGSPMPVTYLIFLGGSPRWCRWTLPLLGELFAGWWWLEHGLYFTIYMYMYIYIYIGTNHPNLLSYFSDG